VLFRSHNQILAVARERADSEPELVRAFLRATARGFAAAAADPQAAAGAMVMVAPMFARAQFAAAVATCAPTWSLDDWGRHDEELVRTYAGWLADEAFLSWRAGHESAFSNDFLPTCRELEGGADG